MFSFIFVLLILFGKDSEVVISGDSIFSLQLQNGRGKFKIFEDQYVDLEITTTPRVPFSVYDESHDIVAKTTTGRVNINTFTSYWFKVRFHDLSNESITCEINRNSDFRKIYGGSISGNLNSSKPAEVLTYTVRNSGTYEFSLSSDDRDGDVDITLYINDHESAATGTTNSNNEKVEVDVFTGDTIMILIFLNEIDASVDWNLKCEKIENLISLTYDSKYNGRISQEKSFQSFTFNNTESTPVLLYLYSNNENTDLDLFVEFDNQEFYSTTYSSKESILLPPSTRNINISIKGYSLENGSTRYSLTTIPVTEFHSVRNENFTKDIDTDNPEVFGVTSSTSKFTYFEVSSLSKRDVDMNIFTDYGSSNLSFSSLNPKEAAVLWLNRNDTVYLMPLVYDRECEIDFVINKIDTDTITKLNEGDTIDDIVRPPYDGIKLYLIEYENSGTAVIHIEGESNRERDVDIFISGKDFYRRSEGEENPTDRASDETVIFSANNRHQYIAEVYAYGRGDRCRYKISSRMIGNTIFKDNNDSQTLWAVIVGISGYPGDDALNRASQDALEFYDILLKSGNIKQENTIFLADENATKENIINSLRKIIRLADENDRILFFFSGHGTQDRYTDGAVESDGYDEAICPYPTEDNSEDIFDNELNSILPHNIEVLIFLDACNSGGFVEDLIQENNRLVITASEEDRTVGERVLTPLLLRAINGEADSNRDGWLTAGEIIDFVSYHSQKICPECLHEFRGSIPNICPNCGLSLSGENRPMNPDLGSTINRNEQLLRIFKRKN